MANIAHLQSENAQVDGIIQELLSVINNEIMPCYQNRLFDQCLMDILKMRIYMAFMNICSVNQLDIYQLFQYITIDLVPGLSGLEIHIDHDGLSDLVRQISHQKSGDIRGRTARQGTL